MELLEAVRGVRKTLRKRGWTKGQMESPSGGVCLAGAFNVTMVGEANLPGGQWDEVFPLYRTFEELLVTAAPEVLGHPLTAGAGVTTFNDSFSTNREVVDRMLDRMEAKLVSRPAVEGS